MVVDPAFFAIFIGLLFSKALQVLMIYAAKKIAEGHDDAYSDVLFRACLYVADLDSDFPNRTMNGSTNGRFAWDVGGISGCGCS